MRILRRLVHALMIVLTLVIGAAAAAIIVSQTAWFKNWLRGYIVREASQYLNGTLTIERLGGNLFFGFEMENIGVSMGGSQVVAVKDLGLRYNAFELFTKGLSVDEIRLDKPVIYVRRDGDVWELSRLVKKQETEAERSGPGRPISIDGIGISDGSVVIDGAVGTSGVDVPKRFDHLDAKLSFKYEPVRYSIDITHVSFRGSDPAIALNALSGGVSVHDDAVNVEKLALRTAETSVSIDGAVQQYLTTPALNLQITSDKLAIPEIARLVPALAGVRLQPAFELKLNGPLDRLGIDMSVRSTAGQFTGNIVADLVEPAQSVAGDLTIRHLDLAPILNDRKQTSDITATAHVDVHGEAFSKIDALRGGVSLDSPRIVAAGLTAGPIGAKAHIRGRRIALTAHGAAYGATATAGGHVTLPAMNQNAKALPIAFDLRGQARRIDLRRMPPGASPVPPAETNVNVDYHVAGAVTTGKNASQNVRGDLRFLPSVVAGARIADGSRVGFAMNGAAIGYDVDGDVGDLDLQRVGQQFKVAALATDRYKSSINAHLTASGHGTKPQEMAVTANGTITDTAVMGGHIPQLGFDVRMANDTAHLKADGSFADFDPAIASDNPKLKGNVGGSLDVEATVENVSKGVTPDSVEGSARVNLQPSSVGGLEIARANVDGDYRESTGNIRALDIAGRDLNVQGSGAVSLSETGQSNFRLHADSPSLERLGKLVDQPLTGIAKLDATVTGNRSELQAAGSLTADAVTYGGNGALAASTNYTVKVPDLDAENVSVTADTHATFVTLGGQTINDVQARTVYHRKEVAFDATARQPQRSLAVGGSLALHPDHQEVHLRQLGLQSQGVSWQLASGAQPTIQYGGNAVTVNDLRLVNGNQRIDADGTFGRAGEALRVTLRDIDVATIDALLLRPPRLSGQLNASSTIGGTKEAPIANADFRIGQGGFRQFHYDSFNGTVKYSRTGVDLDAKLLQNPTTWIEAKGSVPVALFDGTAAKSSERVDLRVDSTPIDLGLVQGFTTALTNVKGTLEAHVNVTGTASDPHPDGAVTVQNAAFKLEPTGVVYTDLDGRITLEPDRVHIDEIRVLDNQRKPLTFTGDLAVHERELGGVSIAMKADDFKVIDNNMGNVRIRSDLRLTGQLTAPRVEGDLGVTTGRIELDPIMAQAGSSAYATQQTEYAGDRGTAPIPDASPAPSPATPTSPDSPAPSAVPAPSAFDALQMDVHLTVPNDLVVRSSDLKSPGAPIGLGALNITLGGDLWMTKVPWDQIRLVGIVNTVRGAYDFQGRRFTIVRDGTVRFEGTDDLDPALDIKTQRVIQAVTANVNVRGTLKKPEIVLSSIPPLEQADIFSLIVFNQPINQVSEGQQISLAQRAEAMAAGAATGQIARSIGSALNVDTFEINMAPETGGGPQVTVGQQVGQNLYVKVQQGIGDQSQTNVILEYELTSWLRLQTNVLQGSSTQQQLFQRMQGSGADMLFFFSY